MKLSDVRRLAMGAMRGVAFDPADLLGGVGTYTPAHNRDIIMYAADRATVGRSVKVALERWFLTIRSSPWNPIRPANCHGVCLKESSKLAELTITLRAVRMEPCFLCHPLRYALIERWPLAFAFMPENTVRATTCAPLLPSNRPTVRPSDRPSGFPECVTCPHVTCPAMHVM